MTSALTADQATPGAAKPTVLAYATVSLVLTVWIAGLVMVVRQASASEGTAAQLLAPLYAQVILTGVVFIVMVIVRNYALIRNIAPSSYYVAYRGDIPRDWVERPARAFNNLMQLPTLFYVACLLTLQLGRVDAAQVSLAWLFVAARALHVVIYIGWNHVPSRFTAYLMGAFALATMWLHLAP